MDAPITPNNNVEPVLLKLRERRGGTIFSLKKSTVVELCFAKTIKEKALKPSVSVRYVVSTRLRGSP